MSTYLDRVFRSRRVEMDGTRTCFFVNRTFNAVPISFTTCTLCLFLSSIAPPSPREVLVLSCPLSWHTLVIHSFALTHGGGWGTPRPRFHFDLKTSKPCHRPKMSLTRTKEPFPRRSWILRLDKTQLGRTLNVPSGSILHPFVHFALTSAMD